MVYLDCFMTNGKTFTWPYNRSGVSYKQFSCQWQNSFESRFRSHHT